MCFRVPTYLMIFILLTMIGCRQNTPRQEAQPVKIPRQDSSIKDTVKVKVIATQTEKSERDLIYGDTIYLNSKGIQRWVDSITTNEFEAYLSVQVDTLDYIIDTVRSSKGSRIVIGYNHRYSLNFIRKNKPWFNLKFDKKSDLARLLGATDSWLESNLNVFDNLIYNKTFNHFIVEFNISSQDNISLLYYIIFNTKGEIRYIGTANSWGGGGSDGEPFLTQDGKLYVSCSEVYNFVTATAMSLSEFASLAEYQSQSDIQEDYRQTHGIRQLGNNLFLAIFNRSHGQPRYNALILNTDSLIVERFSYYGLIEEMDAILLYQELPEKQKSFLFDSDREVLIIIDRNTGQLEAELPLNTISPLKNDTSLSPGYSRIDFGFYASTFFYYSGKDSLVFSSGYVTN